jgi:hypothetical protein
MNGLFRPTFPVLLLWLGATVSLSASPILTLTPDADLFGAPGATVGWGFTITNDVDYIEINSAQFCDNPVNFPVVCISPTTGTFTDFISQFNDIIVGPPGGTDPDSVSQNFDPVALTGVGSFAIDPGALPSDSDVGEIVLTYTETTLDPNDPDSQFVSNGVFTADASVTVSSAATTPEPSTAGLLALALAACGAANLGCRRLSGGRLSGLFRSPARR